MKVNALKYGVERLNTNNYNYIGILDTDIILGSNYYSTLLNELDNEPKVGIAGARFDNCLKNDEGIELTFATNHLGHFLMTLEAFFN